MPIYKEPNVFPGIRRYVAIEITINATGQNNFPDQSQLRGAWIDSVVLETPDVAAKSAVTGNSNIATLADLQNMTISLVRQSNAFVNNKPILSFNPYNMPTGETPNITMRELFNNQPVDWNQCYIKMQAAPSSANIVVSIGVYYYWPNDIQPTQN
jgi:hypothetical protein